MNEETEQPQSTSHHTTTTTNSTTEVSSDGNNMAATQSPFDPAASGLLFGYAFGDRLYDPPPPPPAPAPGQELLDPLEYKNLNNFLDACWSNQPYESLLSGLSREDYDGGGDGDQLLYLDDLPPVLAGSSTSWGSATPLPFGLAEPEPSSSKLARPSQVSVTSPEVLNAASALFQSRSPTEQPLPIGLVPQRQYQNGHHPQTTIGSPTSPMTAQADPLSRQSMYSPPARRTSQPTQQQGPKSILSDSWYLANLQGDLAQPSIHTKAGLMNFGTDVGFMRRGYIPPSSQQSSEAITRGLLQHMECLEPQNSAANTRPASPDDKARGWKNLLETAGSISNEDRRQSRDIIRPKRSLDDTESDEPSHSKKRAKSDSKKHDQSTEEDDLVRTKTKSTAVPAAKSKRASTAAAPSRRASKAPRENLTEEQKRANHIRSEQRRRDAIKQGFEDLCDYFPLLRDTGLTRKDTLIRAADYLENLIEGNTLLKQQLRELDAGASYNGH